MKNRRLWLVVLSFVISIFACVCLAACGGKNDGDNGGNDGDGKDSVVPAVTALTAPTITINIDGEATWGEVTNAGGYAFKINAGDEQTAENRTVLLENNQSIAVKAKGDGVSYSDSEWSDAKTYKAPAGNLPAPENLTVQIQGTDSGKVVVSWDAVAGANGYKYSINGPEQNAAIVEENSVTVDLSAIDATKLDNTWVFQVKAIGEDSEAIANDGDYSALRGSSKYCAGVEFSIADEIYTVAEILKIINYYGEHIPNREFMVAGTIAENKDGDAVLENGFMLFGEYVPELYLAIDDRLEGLEVTAMGTLVSDGDVKGLSSYRSVDFENIAEDDRYDLVIDTLNAWDMLKEDSKIMGDFYLPVKLYGVNILWNVIVDDEDAFVMDKYGNVTVTCPASGADDIDVMLTAMLYVDNDHMYEEDELTFMFAITSDTRIQLAAPKVNINPKTGVATWNKIEHATGYRVEYYGFSIPGDFYSEYVSKNIIIAADGNREVQLKDTWCIKVQAIGDSVAYKDSEVEFKQYNYYPETVEPDGTPLEFDLTKLTQTGTLSDATKIFGLACGNASVFESASAERVELGNSDTNGVVTGTGFIKVGSSKNNGKITLNFNKRIKGVVITARQWNKDQKDKVSVNGSEQQTASKNDWGIMYFNFTASKASKKVEIDTDNRVFIQKITVYVED
ncbi:MAG: hypothetical protein K2J01_02360 [Clostridiales bacterium]|nr:hypothetical protein [Clostridiales bacterium]